MAKYTTPPKALALINKEKTEKTGVLNLNNCGLTQWPDELFDLTWLKVLLIGRCYLWKEGKLIFKPSKYEEKDNQLTTLDHRLVQLPQLTHLVLDFNNIGKIENLKGLINLVELNLIFNWLTKIENLSGLGNLLKLDLGDNQISKIENLEGLQNLLELDLSNNQLTDILPLSDLTNLSKLNLNSNRISDLSALSNLSNLSDLKLWNNQITELTSLKELTNISILHLGVNQITKLDGIEDLINLSELRLTGNNLSSINRLDNLTKLELLDLSGNKIVKLEGLERLSNLSKLYLANNKISKIEGLKKLSKLIDVVLSNNQIRTLENLEDLSNLTELDLSGNKISNLQNINSLSKLSKLYLAGNQIEKLDGLENLSMLSQVFLGNNQIKRLGNIPIKLVERLDHILLEGNPIYDFNGTEQDLNNKDAILGFLKSLQQTQIPTPYLKLNIIGEGRIGKTQLFKFLENNKAQFDEESKQTHGTNTLNYQVPNSRLEVLIWDFGGQSYHHGFHELFIRQKDINLVLWRNNQKTPSFGYWLGTARAFSNFINKEKQLPPLWCVQNVWEKDELYYPRKSRIEKAGINLKDVFAINVKKLFSEHKTEGDEWTFRNQFFLDALHQMVEAWAGQQEVTEEFIAIKKVVDEYNEELPSGNLHAITVQEFRKKFAKAMEDDDIFAYLLSYLEESGSILYEKEAAGLEDIIFLNPPLLSDWLFQRALPSNAKEINNGCISKNSLRQKKTVIKDGEKENLPALTAKEANLFITLMQHFKLIFEKPHQTKEEEKTIEYIIPQFLPEYDHSFKKVLLQLLPFTFSLKFPDFVHQGRIFNFIAQYGPFAEDDTAYWKYGLLYQHPLKQTKDAKLQALVYFQPEERRLFVHLENKKGRNEVARELFDYFVFPKKEEEEANAEKRNPKEQDFNETKERGVRSEHFKRTPDQLKTNVYLATKKERYIDIKQTMKSLVDNAPYGVQIKDRKRIKLDSMSQYLLSDSDKRPLRIFFSYSHKDEQYKKELDVHFAHLRNTGRVETWNDRKIIAGDNWDDNIKKQLEEADILILMLSADFLNSPYIMQREMKIVEERLRKEEKHFKAIPIFTRSCYWKGFEMMKKQGIPRDTDGKSRWIASSQDRDTLYTEIVEEVVRAMDTLGSS
jgi:internalin A